MIIINIDTKNKIIKVDTKSKIDNGGAGSGNWGHDGRPGKVGGSGKDGAGVPSDYKKERRAYGRRLRELAEAFGADNIGKKYKENYYKNIKKEDETNEIKKDTYKPIENKKEAVDYATKTFNLTNNDLNKIKDTNTINLINKVLTDLKDNVKNFEINEIKISRSSKGVIASMSSLGTLTLTNKFFNEDSFEEIEYKKPLKPGELEKKVKEELKDYKYNEKETAINLFNELFIGLEEKTKGTNDEEIFKKREFKNGEELAENIEVFRKDIFKVLKSNSKKEKQDFKNKYGFDENIGNKMLFILRKIQSEKNKKYEELERKILNEYQNFNYFSGDSKQEKIACVINHEIGHNIWFNYLKTSKNIEEEREKEKELNNLYLKYKQYIKCNVSIYSGTNSHEFLAESYSCYKSKRYDLLNDEIINFIKKIEG